MKMTVTNKKLQIGDVDVISIGPTSILLIGDTETLTCSFYFDTPADSLIFDPRVPFGGKLGISGEKERNLHVKRRFKGYIF